MTKEAMPDVVFVLPGIMGSVLEKDGRVVWGYSAGTIARALFTLGGSLRRDLALPYDDPTLEDLDDGVRATRLMPDLHMLPGIWKIDGYDGFVARLKSRFELEDGKNFFAFPYDWRRSNALAAKRLARKAHDVLRAWKEQSGNDHARLILIAHSMGGLVARYYLECLEGWKSCKALITFGTPYRGSLGALDGLANGVKKGPADLTELARQLTSLYELLPIYESFDLGDGQLSRVGERSGIPNVGGDRAEAALGFHKKIREAVEANRRDQHFEAYGTDVFPIVGIAQETGQSARLNGDRVEILNTHPRETGDGDGTVPRVSAIPVEMSDHPFGSVYVGTKHAALQNSDAVFTHVAGLLSSYSINLGNFRRLSARSPDERRIIGQRLLPTSELGPMRSLVEPVALDVEDAYLPSEPIRIRVRPKQPGTELNIQVRRVPSGEAFAPLKPAEDAEGWLVAELSSPGPGAYRVRVDGRGVQPAEDVFVVAEAGEHE